MRVAILSLFIIVATIFEAGLESVHIPAQEISTPAETDYEYIYKSAAKRYFDSHQIDPEIFYRQGIVESGLNPLAHNRQTGAKGVGQFLDKTWQEFGDGSVWCGAKNAEAQVRYMRWLYDRFRGYPPKKRIMLSLAAYNFGIGNIQRGEELPQETKRYITRIMEDSWDDF